MTVYAVVGNTLSGKSSLVRDLVTSTGIKQVTTYTTRPMREGERDGIDYHFISSEEMDNGNYFGRRDFYTVYREEPYSYAMSKDDVFPFEDKILILDSAGVRALKDEIGYGNVVTVFIDAPIDLLVERGKLRGDSEEEVQRRLHVDRDSLISAKYFADIVLDPIREDMLRCMYDVLRGRNNYE
ncbi:MAG: hypothetical protein L0L52_04685 [Staphylococcus equorum]|nr:hypothetical protein [Staphylococcus equorum]